MLSEYDCSMSEISIVMELFFILMATEIYTCDRMA